MRRLNRVPLLIAFGVVVTVIGIIGYTYHVRWLALERSAVALDSPPPPEPASTPQLFPYAPVAGLIGGEEPAASKTAMKQPALGTAPALSTDEVPLGELPSDSLPLQAYHEARVRIEQARLTAWQSALEAPTSVGRQQAVSARTGSRAQHGRPQALIPSSFQARHPASASAFVIRAGTVIPAVMVSGLLSSLPGPLIAQVAENVYDTATGRYCLIPQGAKLLGTYDRAIAMGQERVGVTWTRILYPDGTSHDLGRMPGIDEGGYAGLHDRVNHHYGRTFGQALLLSLLSAGIQLSQPRARAGDAYSSSQIIAGALGQQLGVLGMETVRRNLGIAPTLEIRPGYRFNVMVTQDLYFSKPYPQGGKPMMSEGKHPILSHDAVISRSLEDLETPGVMVEVDPPEAEALGAFEETALDEATAWEANSDLGMTAEGADHGQ